MTNKYELDTLVEVANKAALAAGIPIKNHFRSNRDGHLVKNAKSSIVTIADIEAEAAMRQVISEYFPNHSVKGEELPPTIGPAPYTWILDPIDGTSNFAMGKPIFGSLIVNRHGTGTPPTNRLKFLIGFTDRPLKRGPDRRRSGPLWNSYFGSRIKGVLPIRQGFRMDADSHRERVQHNGGRGKKTAIVAMARKLLIALWKYAAHGVLIEGAVANTAFEKG